MPWHLATERLRLRPMVPEDVDAFAGVVGDPFSMRFYPKPFDRGYMQQLYQYGYQQGLSGSPWRKTLPTTYTVPTASVQRMPVARIVPARAVAQ